VPKGKILVADDAQLILNIITDKLTEDGFEVITAQNGKEAWEKAIDHLPDLIILDVMMPIMTGWEVCRYLRQTSLTNAVPIILLTARAQEDDRIAGFELGADDYIVKPFSLNELLARVKAILARVKRSRQANPLTGLPGNEAIEEVIIQHLEINKPTAVVYADLDNFKAYNDIYGFKQGDKAIKMTSRALSDALEWWENENDFLGHIGGDDFIAILDPDRVEQFCQRVLERFGIEVKYLYKKEDWEKGYLITTNRKGGWEKCPLISLSLAIVNTEEKKIVDYSQLAEELAIMKKKAKAIGGNICIF